MSDEPEGPGWWVASDGKWYPPELHPSVRDGSKPVATSDAAAAARFDGAEQNAQPPQTVKAAHVGPQFPDLFQKALDGSHLADNVSVKCDGDDGRNIAATFYGGRGGTAQTTSAAPAGTASATKRRWRKGH